jgi:hypothetical protein
MSIMTFLGNNLEVRVLFHRTKQLILSKLLKSGLHLPVTANRS